MLHQLTACHWTNDRTHALPHQHETRRPSRAPSSLLTARRARVQPGARVLPSGKSATVPLREGGEVIVAAGAIHSPQILMLSGVGPASDLKAVGVDVVADSPGVGTNLQDHPACLSAFTLKESAGPIAITDHLYHADASLKKRQMLNWALFGKGPLTSTACDRGAFVKTQEKLRQPDLQLRYVAGCALNPDGVGSFVDFGRKKVRSFPGVTTNLLQVCCARDAACMRAGCAAELRKPCAAYVAPVVARAGIWATSPHAHPCTRAQESGDLDKWPSGITFQIIACRPKSRGSVRIASSTISDPPKIDLGYLSDKDGADLQTLREGLRLSRKLAATDAWSALLEDEMHPGQSVQQDDQIDGYIRKTLHSANALVGTCALGPVGQGVVSPDDFRVHGVAGLRVVDSSVMPHIPGGQTGAPTVMIAERAAAMMTQGLASIKAAEPELAMAA
jgi:choline dehydrogenase-like flavoprotein